MDIFSPFITIHGGEFMSSLRTQTGQLIKVPYEGSFTPVNMVQCCQVLLQQYGDDFDRFKVYCMDSLETQNRGGPVKLWITTRFRASASTPFTVYAVQVQQKILRAEWHSIMFYGGKSSETPWHCIPNCTYPSSNTEKSRVNNNKENLQPNCDAFVIIDTFESRSDGSGKSYACSGAFTSGNVPRSTFTREISDAGREFYLQGDVLFIVCPRIEWKVKEKEQEPQIGSNEATQRTPIAKDLATVEVFGDLYEEKVHVMMNVCVSEEVHKQKADHRTTKRGPTKRKRSAAPQQQSSTGNAGKKDSLADAIQQSIQSMVDNNRDVGDMSEGDDDIEDVK